MTARPGLGAPTGVDDNDLRRSLSALVVPGSATDPLVVRSGVFYSPGNPLKVSQSSPLAMTALVQPGVAAVHRAGQGPYFPTNDGVATVTFAAAPGANSRWDLVYIVQADATAGDANSSPGLLVVTGTPLAVPVKPYASVPAGGLVLAEVGPILTTTTQITDALIANVYVYTAVRGTPVPVRNQTERDALTLFDGQLANRLDTDLIERYNGTAWTGTLARFKGVIATATVVTGGAMWPFGTGGFSVAEDNLAAWNAGTVKWVAPTAGTYLVMAQIRTSAAIAGGFIAIQVNGAYVAESPFLTQVIGGGGNFSCYLRLNAGDGVAVAAGQTFTTANGATLTTDNWFEIVQVAF
jgi:hypothetical protein